MKGKTPPKTPTVFYILKKYTVGVAAIQRGVWAGGAQEKFVTVSHGTQQWRPGQEKSQSVERIG